MVTATVHETPDPLKGMLQFHRSIRAALDTFDELARQADFGPANVVKAQALSEFFTGPMRWHDIDERESLLRRLTHAAPHEFAHAVADSIADHDRLEIAVAAVLEHLQNIAHLVEWPDAELLSAAAAELRRILEPHMLVEERELFPRARRLLSVDDLEAIEAEIAARRRRRAA